MKDIGVCIIPGQIWCNKCRVEFIIRKGNIDQSSEGDTNIEFDTSTEEIGTSLNSSLLEMGGSPMKYGKRKGMKRE